LALWQFEMVGEAGYSALWGERVNTRTLVIKRINMPHSCVVKILKIYILQNFPYFIYVHLTSLGGDCKTAC